MKKSKYHLYKTAQVRKQFTQNQYINNIRGQYVGLICYDEQSYTYIIKTIKGETYHGIGIEHLENFGL
jgi:hypothetical protein